MVGAILNIYFIQFILCSVFDAREAHDLDKKKRLKCSDESLKK